MSASDEWGTYETPCPNCGGSVDYWYFGADCRGNDSSGGIKCKGECERDFTSAEWQIIASDEMEERERKQELLQLAFKAKYIMETVTSSPEVPKKLEEALFAGDKPSEFTPELSRFHQQLVQYAKTYQKMEEI